MKSSFEQVRPFPPHLARTDRTGHAIIDYTGYPRRVNDRLGRPLVIRRAIDKTVARGLGLKPRIVVMATGERIVIWRPPMPEIAVHESIRRQIKEKLTADKAA